MQQLAVVDGLGEAVGGAMGQHGVIERRLVAAEQHYGVLLPAEAIEAGDHLLWVCSVLLPMITMSWLPISGQSSVMVRDCTSSCHSASRASREA